MDFLKKPGVAIFIFDKIDSKTKARDKDHYIILKGLIQQENTTLVNMYAPTTGTRKHVKETLIDKARD